jgi:MinD superfamily P-loop ATPase
MIVAVASGKGGTGKTTVAVSLALSLGADAAQRRQQQDLPLLLDCDVEAPNAHTFLNPVSRAHEPVTLPVPQVDPSRCDGCGMCAEACAFHAIAVLGGQVLVFPSLCHGCGNCVRVCPQHALTEADRRIGLVEKGRAGAVEFARGIMDVGEAMPVPVIRKLKKWAPPRRGQTAILDAPPGTSCSVVSTLHGADYALLVTEPTPFGLHDLRLAVQVARQLGLPIGVVINRDGLGFDGVEAFCRSEGLPVLLRIPFGRHIAAGLARGRPLTEIDRSYVPLLQGVAARILRQTEGLRSRMAVQSPAPGTAITPPHTIDEDHPSPAAAAYPGAAPSKPKDLGDATIEILGSDALTIKREPQVEPRQLVILSGKGGTGKTSIAAALAHIAGEGGAPVVMVDADVDASNLELLLQPERRHAERFIGGRKASLDPVACEGCGECQAACRFDAITFDRTAGVYGVDTIACEGCGACASVCPCNAIQMQAQIAGRWFRSETRFGPLLHAALTPGAENSGKLVARIKQEARLVAGDLRRPLLIIDGPPGIGCPAISAAAGADLALIVTEPTLSALHDMERIADMLIGFRIPAMVCVNKVDLNPSLGEAITAACRARGLDIVGTLPYAEAVAQAMVEGLPVTAYPEAGPILGALHAVWERVQAMLLETEVAVG